MEKLTISVREAAEMLGVSLPLMYTITHRSDFYPLLCVGRKRLIITAKFERWINEQSREGTGA